MRFQIYEQILSFIWSKTISNEQRITLLDHVEKIQDMLISATAPGFWCVLSRFSMILKNIPFMRWRPTTDVVKVRTVHSMHRWSCGTKLNQNVAATVHGGCFWVLSRESLWPPCAVTTKPSWPFVNPKVPVRGKFSLIGVLSRQAVSCLSILCSNIEF